MSRSNRPPQGQPRQPVDGGSVRRAREQAGAGLTYFPYESGDQTTLASYSTSPPGVNRSLSQTSGHWNGESQQLAASDILQHPLMTQPGAAQHSGNGDLAQNFVFPPVPDIPNGAGGSRRPREYIPPPSRRAGPNFHLPIQVSPIVEEDHESSIRSKSQYSHASTGMRSSGLLAAHTSSPLVNQNDPYDSESLPASTPAVTPRMRQVEDPGIVRQANPSNSAKPAIKNIKPWGVDQQHFQDDRLQRQQVSPHPDTRQGALNALTAAVASVATEPNIHQQPPPRPMPSRTNTGGLRMPFESTSPPLSPQEVLHPPPAFHLPTSTRSRSPLLAPDSENPDLSFPNHAGMSDRIPSDRRPAKLDMDAVTANERASTTSLADLIKRATKLASNLDRGKTASRLGLLDMFYGDNKAQRRDPNEKRGSGISDMLSAFPMAGTPTRSQTQLDKWPAEGVKMERYPANGNDKKRRRKCCGLSVPVFMILLLVLIILIAAAVLVPLFLIVFPRNKHSTENSVTSASCRQSLSCRHGGQSVVVAGSCSCICTGAWTGFRCEKAGTAACTTTHVPGITVENVNMGSAVLPLLQDSQTNFSVPLDSGLILGIFSQAGMSCDLENSLISFSEFSAGTKVKQKRFYILPEFEEQLMAEAPQITAAPSAASEDFQIAPRQAPTSTATSSNGIVFQATSSDLSATAVPAATSAVASAAGPSATASTGNPAGVEVSARVLNFARVVVLYVLEQSATLSIAVNAQQLLKNQLLAGDTRNVIEVGFGNLDLRADLNGEKIIWGNGTTIGGGPSSGG